MKDLMVREVYNKNGEEKVSWNKIGVLIDGSNGKQYVKLFHMPGVLVSCFEQKPREDKVADTNKLSEEKAWDS